MRRKVSYQVQHYTCNWALTFINKLSESIFPIITVTDLFRRNQFFKSSCSYLNKIITIFLTKLNYILLILQLQKSCKHKITHKKQMCLKKNLLTPICYVCRIKILYSTYYQYLLRLPMQLKINPSKPNWNQIYLFLFVARKTKIGLVMI